MKKLYSLFALCAIFTLSLVAQDIQEAFVPDAGAVYGFQADKTNNNQWLTVLEKEDASLGLIVNHYGNGDNPEEYQYFQFVPVVGQEGVYGILSYATKKYLALIDEDESETGGRWTCVFADDLSSVNAQFELELADNAPHIYVKCLANNKYMGLNDEWDQSKAGCSVYLDKGQGNNSNWRLEAKTGVEPSDPPGVSTSVASVSADDVKVFVENGFIRVVGAADFKVYSITGAQVNAGGALSAGLYIVLAGDNQYKVLVK